jgi:hypothetical protein
MKHKKRRKKKEKKRKEKKRKETNKKKGKKEKLTYRMRRSFRGSRRSAESR